MSKRPVSSDVEMMKLDFFSTCVSHPEIHLRPPDSWIHSHTSTLRYFIYICVCLCERAQHLISCDYLRVHPSAPKCVCPSLNQVAIPTSDSMYFIWLQAPVHMFECIYVFVWVKRNMHMCVTDCSKFSVFLFGFFPSGSLVKVAAN